jgi:hypothetical protein
MLFASAFFMGFVICVDLRDCLKLKDLGIDISAFLRNFYRGAAFVE